jgi:hypothetical protein
MLTKMSLDVRNHLVLGHGILLLKFGPHQYLSVKTQMKELFIGMKTIKDGKTEKELSIGMVPLGKTYNIVY